MSTFGCLDTFILANRFSVAELRHEAQQAEQRAIIASFFRGTPYEDEADLFPWADFARCCREAISSVRASKPAATPITGRLDIEAIKAKSDIVAVASRYTDLRKSGKNFSGRCPLHADKNPSFMVYPGQQTFHCYGCNRGGDVIELIKQAEHTDFRGATAILGGA